MDLTSVGVRNRIINGDMMIDQRYCGSATANTINGYTVDRWYLAQSPVGKIIGQRSTSTPPIGFNYYYRVTSQSAFTVGAGDVYNFQQGVEADNIRDLQWGTANAKGIVLSFWVRSSLTGTFSGWVHNPTDTRSYVFNYTIAAANTWQYVSVVIPGDTSGTWTTGGNTVGLRVGFCLGVGSSFQTPSVGSWQSNGALASTSSVSLVGTSGATLDVTGVQFEVGAVATPFELRDFTSELLRCQRYYQKSYRYDVSPGTAAGNAIA